MSALAPPYVINGSHSQQLVEKMCLLDFVRMIFLRQFGTPCLSLHVQLSTSIEFSTRKNDEDYKTISANSVS